MLAAGLAACGNVTERVTPDAVPAIDAAPMIDVAPAIDAWSAGCVPMAVVTTVESADPGFGNNCVHGSWYLQAFNGTTMPVTAGRPDNQSQVMPEAITLGTDPLDPSSTFAVHVSGKDQVNTPPAFAFAQLTASLNTLSATQIGTVDVTAFTGVQFYAIINTGSTGARFTIGNLFTDPAGGKCTTVPNMATSCFDNPGAQLAPSTTWTKYQLPFASLVQLGFGNPSPVGAAFPKGAIVHVRWDLGIPPTGPTEPWDIWVDDLTFY